MGTTRKFLKIEKYKSGCLRDYHVCAGSSHDLQKLINSHIEYNPKNSITLGGFFNKELIPIGMI